MFRFTYEAYIVAVEMWEPECIEKHFNSDNVNEGDEDSYTTEENAALTEAIEQYNKDVEKEGDIANQFWVNPDDTLHFGFTVTVVAPRSKKRSTKCGSRRMHPTGDNSSSANASS